MVTARYYQAVEVLVSLRITRVARLCDEMGVDRRNWCKQRADHSRHILRPAWLAHLVTHYGVSASWLLTGRGEMFSPTAKA